MLSVTRSKLSLTKQAMANRINSHCKVDFHTEGSYKLSVACKSISPLPLPNETLFFIAFL